MTDSLLFKIYAFAQNYYSKDKSGHGFDHIRRVYENACRLLEKEKNAVKLEAAKAEAQKRHDYMVGFLREFFTEQNLAAWNDYLTEYLNK